MEKNLVNTDSIFRKITRRVFTGIFTIIPLAVTIFIIYIVIMKIYGIFGILLVKFVGITSVPLNITLSVVAAILSFYLIGIFGTTFIVKRFLHLGERLVSRIPVVRFFYNTTKQIIQTMALPSKGVFKKVVMIEYPRKGIYSLAFVTGDIKFESPEREFVNLFYPSTPNPTTGFFLMLNKEDIYDINISIEDAIKLIISGGIIVPDNIKYTKGVS